MEIVSHTTIVAGRQMKIPAELTNNIEQELQAGRIRIVTTFPSAFVVLPLGALMMTINRVYSGIIQVQPLTSGTYGNNTFSKCFNLLYLPNIEPLTIMPTVT